MAGIGQTNGPAGRTDIINTNTRTGGAAKDNSQVLLVSAIDPSGPAQRGGIQLNDLITHIDGNQVINGRLTMHEIALKRPGDSVAVTLVRADEVLELQILVGTRPHAEAS